MVILEVTPASLKTALLKWFTDHQTGTVVTHEQLVQSGYSPREAVEIAGDVLFNLLEEAE